jgi:D-threonate/D-erythronate kinase
MHTDKIAIIADDYTGAGDAGVHFARFGRKIELLLHRDALSGQSDGSGDVALSSETRFLSPQDAAAVMTDLVEQCRVAGYRRIFKKIDSTMRGNPGSEIAAVLDATGHAGALICPAMPKTGRTCVDGAIYVDGKPLHLSDISSDPFHPLETSLVTELLRAQTPLAIGTLNLKDVEASKSDLRIKIASMLEAGVRLIVADAADDRHLAALADQVLSCDLLPVGAGGLAEAYAATCAPDDFDYSGLDIRLHRPIVTIVGSMATASREQADHAEKSGRFVAIEIGPETDLAEIDQICDERLALLNAEKPNVLLRVAPVQRGKRMLTQEGERVAEKIGHAAASICRRIFCRTVVSTGGSTSMAVARALGIQSVDLVDEIVPGIVVGACHDGDGGIEWFVSKAGGFGKPDLLTEIDARCTNLRPADRVRPAKPAPSKPFAQQGEKTR